MATHDDEQHADLFPGHITKQLLNSVRHALVWVATSQQSTCTVSSHAALQETIDYIHIAAVRVEHAHAPTLGDVGACASLCPTTKGTLVVYRCCKKLPRTTSPVVELLRWLS